MLMRATVRRRSQPAEKPPAARWWAVAGALLGVAVTLVFQAPAAWLAIALQSATDGKVALIDPRGTVWTGSGRLRLSGGDGSQASAALPTRLDWRARPAWSGLNLEMLSACCTASPVAVALRPHWGGLQVLVAPQTANPTPSIRLPASLLQGLGSPWNTLEFDGSLSLSFQGLSVEWTQGRIAVAGRVELIASGMSSRLSTPTHGRLLITISGGDTTRLDLATIEGSLQLSGSGQWVGSRLRFSGEASAAPEREAALSNLLNIIGRRNGARSIISVG